VLLGLIAAVSLYAKLSSGLLLLVAGLWILWDAPLRRQLAQPAPWLGLLVFLIASLPLLNWLAGSHFSPLLYAAERSEGTAQGPLQFLGAQVLACLGLIGLAAVSGLVGQSREAGSRGPPRPDRQTLTFLAVMTLAPMLLTALAAIALGAGLKSMWGSPMFGLAGLLTVALTSPRVTNRALWRLVLAVGVLLVTLPAGYAIDTAFEARLTGKPKRQNWPQAEIAARFDRIWRGQTGRPLRIVAGERWIAGLAALRPGPMPSILTDGNLALSPWITEARLHEDGALVIWEMKAASDRPPAALAGRIRGRPLATEQFNLPRFPNAKPLLIGYAIVPPG